MKSIYTYASLLLITTLSYSPQITAQTTWGDSLSVKVEAIVQASPPSIFLKWPADADATNFTIFRKAKGATAWGPSIATVPGSDSTYLDLSSSLNVLYDYKIQMTSVSTPTKYGYLSSGIGVVANSNRGIAILVVEDSYTMNTNYQNALQLFIDDFELDGWFVKTVSVNALDAVSDVKANIVAMYNEDVSNTRLLVLIGNVPVPYSGNLNPDGHPDHQGAWPTDLYYADINGTWTDATINNTTSANALNHNIPADGKFDQTYIPSDVDLQVGRIDLSNMPAFSESEETLLIRYFNKAHAYKTGNLTVGEQALIDDGFTSYTEGFSQNGYNNFSALVGMNNVIKANYFTQLSYSTSTTGTYLWSYGCGGGTYTSASGIGNTTTFAADSLSSIFTMLFGSYFGDWNYTNAFLRAPLAQGNTLTNCWAGRPNWYFNHMAMGENIGYSARLSQNNAALYTPSTLGGLARMVSINFMGDPSLRLTYIAAPTNLVVVEGGNSNQLNWTAGGTEIGYNIYRRYDDSTNFLKLNATLITATTYTDNSLSESGIVHYYVKAVELKTTPSGSYENESLGAKVTAQSTVVVDENTTLEFSLYPNPSHNFIYLKSSTSLNSTYLIYDTKGALVQDGNAIGDLVKIDISALSKGIYQIQLSDIFTQSFIKE